MGALWFSQDNKCEFLILSQLSWDFSAFLLVFHNWPPENIISFPSVYLIKKTDRSMMVTMYFYLFVCL